MNLADARAFVGTTPLSGVGQLAVLMQEGLRPQHRVLEYGCGTLHLAKVLVPYLERHHYRAVDPNIELRDAARRDDPDLASMLVDRGAIFGDADDFDADIFGEHGFDYVFAHSVLSHAAAWQLPQFLEQAEVALRPGGKIIASLRVGEDTNAVEWQYPGVSFFSPGKIKRCAADAGLVMRFAFELQKMYMAICPDEIHDWVVLERGLWR